MTDQTSQFFAILTAVGEAKQANANALGVPWTFAQMGVGDANLTDPIPSRDQKKLINERRRAPLNQVKVDPDNASVIIAEQVIPPDVGGWWIREIGLYDADGDLVAVANCAPSFKPLLSQGTGKTQVVRLNIIVTSTANVQLKIDPSVVLATREYVDSSILSVLPKNKVAGTFTKIRTSDRGIVIEGSNPTTLAGYGIGDAFTKAATSAAIQAAIDGVVNGAPGLLNQLNKLAAAIDNDPNFAGTMVNALAGKASLASPTFTGVVNVPTAAASTNSTQAASTAFVRAAIAALVGSSPTTLDTLKELADALGNDPNFAVTMTNALATKAAKATTLAGYGITDAYTQVQVNNLLTPKAPLVSPTFTGTVVVPTPVAGASNSQAASTKFVTDAISNLVAAAPAALDTLNELALALGNDPNFASTITNALAGKAEKATTLMGYGITDGVRVSSDQFPEFYSKTPGNDWRNGAIQIRETARVGNTQSAITYAPAITFHWGDRVFRQLLMSAAGDLHWGPNAKIYTTEHTGAVGQSLMAAGDVPSARTILGIANTSAFGGASGFWRDAQTGMIIQYGSVFTPAEANYSSVFHMAFPNYCLMCIPTTVNSATGDDDSFARVIGWTRQNVTFRSEGVPNAGLSPNARSISYIAIGY